MKDGEKIGIAKERDQIWRKINPEQMRRIKKFKLSRCFSQEQVIRQTQHKNLQRKFDWTSG